MRNRMYGGVRGRKTKVGEKLLRFPPTRLISDLIDDLIFSYSMILSFYPTWLPGFTLPRREVTLRLAVKLASLFLSFYLRI